MNILTAQGIALVGIGGTGMRGLARLLHARNAHIYGTDSAFAEINADPRLGAYHLFSEAETDQILTLVDLVIYSDAVPQTHPILQKAQAVHMPCLRFSEALGALTHLYATVGVAGTHGKSSTTGMLAHILISANKDPSALVGAALIDWDNENAHIGTSELLIVEADEFRDHFLDLQCRDAIITTIDFDHPDYFTSEAAVVESFIRYIGQLDRDGTVVTTEAVFDLLDGRAMWPTKTVVVPIPAKDVSLTLPGAHMQLNAQLAIAMAETLGVPQQDAIAALKTFKGLRRRFERLGQVGAMTVISDYGHHPAEIKATLRGALALPETEPIVVIVEPHTTERLSQFMPAYAAALALATEVIVTPIHIPTGREQARTNSKQLTQFLVNSLHAQGTRARYLDEYDKLAATLASLSETFTTCLCFSAGRLDAVLRDIVKAR